MKIAVKFIYYCYEYMVYMISLCLNETNFGYLGFFVDGESLGAGHTLYFRPNIINVNITK
jgi:hypothetical protein